MNALTTKHEDTATLFGATRLGYAIVESRRLERWWELLEKGLGLHIAHADENELAFRMDEHARRIVVCDGPAEDVVALGWQVRDEQALRLIVERLRAAGIAVETGTEGEAASRGVQSFVRIRGPKDLALELFTQPLTSHEPLDMHTSGFVTGEAGMGHVAITSKFPAEMRRFWEELFDARLSDSISQPMAGMMLDIEFLRLNKRHHSIAIAAPRGLRLDPIRTRIQHLNIEAATLDDLERAFTRCRHLGFEMAHEIGQHPNDRELSFYVLTPSGFEIEFGWNARTVEEHSWRPASYDGISLWGHKPERASVVHLFAGNAANIARGLRSLLHREYSPLQRGTTP